jgi:hypothetical protein
MSNIGTEPRGQNSGDGTIEKDQRMSSSPVMSIGREVFLHNGILDRKTEFASCGFVRR